MMKIPSYKLHKAEFTVTNKVYINKNRVKHLISRLKAKDVILQEFLKQLLVYSKITWPKLYEMYNSDFEKYFKYFKRRPAEPLEEPQEEKEESTLEIIESLDGITDISFVPLTKEPLEEVHEEKQEEPLEEPLEESQEESLEENNKKFTHIIPIMEKSLLMIILGYLGYNYFKKSRNNREPLEIIEEPQEEKEQIAEQNEEPTKINNADIYNDINY